MSAGPAVYAKIDMSNPGNGTGTVIDTQVLDPAQDQMDQNFTWIEIDNINPEPSIGWTYDGTNFHAPPGPTLTLAQAIALQQKNFYAAFNGYVGLYFTVEQRLSFFMMYELAKENLQLNRQAYIKPLLNWGNGCIAYSATYLAALNAKTTAADALAFNWDFTQINPGPPNITLIGAIAIAN